MIKYESIETTLPKAKEIVPYVEKLITKAKKGDLHKRRQIIAALQTLTSAHKLVDEIAPKLSGRVMSLTIASHGAIKMVRCVELPSLTEDDISSVLYPTFAYMEDELNARPQRLFLAGFGDWAIYVGPRVEAELRVVAEQLPSRFGQPDAENAGLLGYLEARR